LSRAFGDGDNMPYVTHVPDVFYNKITPNTKYIIMACDGLWDVINNNELFSLIYKIKKKSKNIAIGLANEALARKSTDNISVIVMEFE
jgi:serine/threonine protein phosphatase PrpC